MPEILLVSSRGQITLPASMRQHLGIQPGDMLIIEERDGELTLKLATMLPVEHYSDEQIAQWDSADRLTSVQKRHILTALPGA